MDYAKHFAINILWGAVVCAFAYWIIITGMMKISLPAWAMIPAGFIVVLVSAVVAHVNIWLYKTQELEDSFEKKELEYSTKVNELETQRAYFEKRAIVLRQALLERSTRFPSLLEIIQHYETIEDEYTENQLRTKKHPAPKSADTLHEYNQRRRVAVRQARELRFIIDQYESVAPWLTEYLEDSEENIEIDPHYTVEELGDPITTYLSREEYLQLPSWERNQKALERYWTKRHGPIELGRMYERYVGYLFEQAGYKVTYTGIERGLSDLGIDLECRKDRELLLIQCKNWAFWKTLFEKHVFQLFGTSYLLRKKLTESDSDLFTPIGVRAVFCATIEVSDDARIFAAELDVELHENLKLDKLYPCIKCNVSRSDDKTKIYHLPFDQQYDKTLVESNRGEFYCSTTAEAEDMGFRRAYRYRGTRQKNA